MKLELTLDDAVYDKLVEAVGKPQVQAEVRRRIALLDGVSKEDRAVVIYGEDRRKIEAVLQTTLESGAHLAREVHNMSKLKIGTIERGFNTSELVRLETEARFHGWPTDKYLALISEEAMKYVTDRY